MKFKSLSLATLALVSGGFLLAACDEAEQGRVLQYEKGTYLGEPDQALSQEDRDKLIQRARLQQGS
jgi:hypothetical protein